MKEMAISHRRRWLNFCGARARAPLSLVPRDSAPPQCVRDHVAWCVSTETTPVLRGFMAVVSLSLIPKYVFRKWGSSPKGKDGCGKVRCPKLGVAPPVKYGNAGGRGTVSAGSGVSLPLQVCLVVLALLLMAGDVERNPGPTGKEGSCLC